MQLTKNIKVNFYSLLKPFFNSQGFVLLTQDEYKAKLYAQYGEGYQDRLLEEQAKQ